jgi:hypothetical protein
MSSNSASNEAIIMDKGLLDSLRRALSNIILDIEKILTTGQLMAQKQLKTWPFLNLWP